MKDLVIINGQINTMADGSPFAEAVAVKEGRIIKVGTNEEVRRAMPFGAEVIDARGNSVFPGFFDTHVHFSMTGENLASVQLYDVSSGQELFTRMTRAAEKMKPGEWLKGVGYNELEYAPGDFPDLKKLDEVFPSRPVILSRVDEHQLLLNSIALKEMNVCPGDDGAELDEDGELTGIIKDPLNGRVRQIYTKNNLTDSMFRRFYAAASDEALKHGTTTVCCLEGGDLCDEKSADAFLKYQESIPLHTHLYHQTMDVKKVLGEGQKQIGGCILLDGSLGSHTAALTEDYADLKGCRGKLCIEPDVVEDFILEAHLSGLQASMHCIGDLAIEVLLRAYEKALARYPRANHRHRFEHFTLPTWDQVERARRLGCAMGIQPAYLAGKSMYVERVGEERLDRVNLIKTLMGPGFFAGGGSDAPVTPMNPFIGISEGMMHYNERERITLDEGLRLFTTEAAKLTFEENEKGTVEEGKIGDFAIIDRNIREMDLSDPNVLKEIQFTHTIVEGEIKYAK